MIAAFMLYALAISAIVSIAALLLDKTCAAMNWPRRAAWLAAMLLSVIAPIVMQTSGSEPESSTPAPMQTITLPSAPTEAIAAPATNLPVYVHVEQRRDFAWPSLPSLDAALTFSWLALSIGLLLFYGRAWLLLRRHRDAWRSERVDGTNALVSDDIGPAVVGFWRSRIVVPRWLVAAPPSTRALALRHEAEHISARDPLALLLALALVAMMPWNVALWWQLRRLRFAIELDCDARVLRDNTNPADYGETLLLVGRRHHGVPLGAVALTEPPSDLEKRIHIMMTGRSRFAALTAFCCAALCTSLLAATTQVNAPANEEMRRLPPPQPSFAKRVEKIVRAEFPDVFDATLNEPVLLNVLLDNNYEIEIATKKTLAPGTTLDAALPPDAPNNGFTAEQLHPADERWVGRLVYQDRPASAPVFLNFAIRGVHRTKSASVVEPIIRKTLPHLYDETPDGKVLVTAVFGASGTLKYEKHAAYTSDDALVGRENQLKQLASAGVAIERIGTTAVIGGSETAPFKPTVLYAFEKSDDPRLEAHPLNPETIEEVDTQRVLVERYFPQATARRTQPHELLWILLNEKGEVVRTGRAPSNPEALADSMASVEPRADVFARRTKPVGALLGRDVLDVQQQPVLVTFLWSTFDSASDEPSSGFDVLVDSTIYRDDEIVSSSPLSLRFGQRQSREIADALRLEMSAIDVKDGSVELRLRIQARAEKKGVEYADPWETAMEPAIRIRYGEEGTIELGIQYPGDPNATVWRLELTPRRAAG